jgi:hypothetical protein
MGDARVRDWLARLCEELHVAPERDPLKFFKLPQREVSCCWPLIRHLLTSQWPKLAVKISHSVKNNP